MPTVLDNASEVTVTWRTRLALTDKRTGGKRSNLLNAPKLAHQLHSTVWRRQLTTDEVQPLFKPNTQLDYFLAMIESYSASNSPTQAEYHGIVIQDVLYGYRHSTLLFSLDTYIRR